MTEQQYLDHFRRFSCSSEMAEHRIYIYSYRPDKLRTVADVQREDADTKRRIAELQEYLEFLNFHRQKLAARYGQLETMLYTDILTISRYKHYHGNVSYYVEIERTMEDGTKTTIQRETFEGKERHKAYALFRELKSKHPGIIAEDKTKS